MRENIYLSNCTVWMSGMSIWVLSLSISYLLSFFPSFLFSLPLPCWSHFPSSLFSGTLFLNCISPLLMSDTCISLQHFVSTFSSVLSCISPPSYLLLHLFSHPITSTPPPSFCPSPPLPPRPHLWPHLPLSAHHLSSYPTLISDPTLPPSFSPSSLLPPRPHLFHPAASEIDWSSSFGTVSTVSLLSHPPLPVPLDPSAPPPAPASRLNTDPEGTTHPARPSPYVYQVPAFVCSYPPALPEIFQPAAGSGTGKQTDWLTVLSMWFWIIDHTYCNK